MAWAKNLESSQANQAAKSADLPEGVHFREPCRNLTIGGGLMVDPTGLIGEARKSAEAPLFLVGRVTRWPSGVIVLPDIEDGDAVAALYSDVHFAGAVVEISVSADRNVGQVRPVVICGARSVLKFDQNRVPDFLQYFGEVGMGASLPEVGYLPSPICQ